MQIVVHVIVKDAMPSFSQEKAKWPAVLVVVWKHTLNESYHCGYSQSVHASATEQAQIYVLYTPELELVDVDLDQNFSTAFLLLLKIIIVIVLTCFEFQYIDLEYCFIEQIHDGLPITDWFVQLRLLFSN